MLGAKALPSQRMQQTSRLIDKSNEWPLQIPPAKPFCNHKSSRPRLPGRPGERDEYQGCCVYYFTPNRRPPCPGFRLRLLYLSFLSFPFYPSTPAPKKPPHPPLLTLPPPSP